MNRNNTLSQNKYLQIPFYEDFYIPVKYKFIISNTIAIVWFVLSCYISCGWVISLSKHTTLFPAWFIVLFIALIPGYLNMFLLTSLLLDKPPKFNQKDDLPPVSLLIAAYNEEKCIAQTLSSIKQQNYTAPLEIIIVDDGSTDKTRDIILKANMTNTKLIKNNHSGKAAALNRGLQEISHGHMITLDADTFLHPQAVTRIMTRMLSDPNHTSAVAGCVLTKNSRDSFITQLQKWDYFLAISSIKRQQSLYQGTLVAQGAFSLFKTEIVRSLGGWSNCIGEDIVFTWGMIKAGYRIGFESTAIGFTDVPVTFKQFARQRRRWSRGMIEGFKNHFNLLYKNISMTKFLIALDLLFPIIDFTYTFVYIPGIVLAFLGKFWIAGPMTLAVLPLTFLINYVMYKHQSTVFGELNLTIRRNHFGFIAYTLMYQLLMSPVCVWGYLEEIFGCMKRW